jgi:hypothetical protein
MVSLAHVTALDVRPGNHTLRIAPCTRCHDAVSDPTAAEPVTLLTATLLMLCMVNAVTIVSAAAMTLMPANAVHSNAAA